MGGLHRWKDEKDIKDPDPHIMSAHQRVRLSLLKSCSDTAEPNFLIQYDRFCSCIELCSLWLVSLHWFSRSRWHLATGSSCSLIGTSISTGVSIRISLLLLFTTLRWWSCWSLRSGWFGWFWFRHYRPAKPAETNILILMLTKISPYTGQEKQLNVATPYQKHSPHLSLENCKEQNSKQRWNKKKYLSSASAFFLTSADKRTGVAYLGSESWCCFFSLNQASASTHSFKTYHIPRQWL
jgi:hypothetical protein